MSRPHRDQCAQVPDVHPYTYICLHMPRPHTQLPAAVHTALTCHTCDSHSHLHSQANQPMAPVVPLAHIHACRPHLQFSGFTQEEHTSTSCWCMYLNTCTPFRCSPVYPGVSPYTTHIRMHTCVCTPRPHTSIHLFRGPLSPGPLLLQQQPPRALELLCPQGKPASKLTLTLDPQTLLGASRNAFRTLHSLLGYPKGLSSPPSSHPSLYNSHHRQKMGSGAGQHCQGTQAGAPPPH